MKRQDQDQKEHSHLVSDGFGNTQKEGTFEPAFRRWLVNEITTERISVKEAIARFNFHPMSGHSMIAKWMQRYAPSVEVALHPMTEKEKADNLALRERLKELEKQLELASMKNIALDLLIDVAEENLKISIRKKAGTKQ